MRRRHLFEIEDQTWCPAFLRDCLTEYLKQFESMFNIYNGTLPIIERGLARGDTRRVIDLCSGASGPWPHLVPDIPNAEVCLTDMYPNQSQAALFNRQTRSPLLYYPKPVDATNVPEDLIGLRTLYTSFHHFEPEQARAILSDAVKKKAPIAIFEFTERSLANAVLHPIVTPFVVLIVSLFIRPVSWARVALTYVIPLVPLMVTWDGYVSNLRTYSLSELDELTDCVGKEEFEWETGRLRTGFPSVTVTYLLGYPKT